MNKTMKIAVYSLSTCITHSAVKKQPPLEISAVELRNQRNTFHSYVSTIENIPYTKIPGIYVEATRAVINKIGWEASHEYPSIAEALSLFSSFLSTNEITHIFAHRGSCFDELILKELYKNYSMDIPNVTFIDTLPLFRHDKNHGKRSLYELCGIHLPANNISMKNALDSCHALCSLLKEFEYQGLIQLDDVTNDQSFTKSYNKRLAHMDNKWIVEFMLADEDKNGFIDLDEFKSWYISKYESIFASIDMNGDGVISKSEFQANYVDLGMSWLDEFMDADHDRNGFIDMNEFKDWHISKTEALFKEADKNNDGVLSKGEFKAFIAKLS